MNLVTNLVTNRLQMKSTATKAGFEIREKSNTISRFVHDEIFSLRIFLDGNAIRPFFEEKQQFLWTKVTNKARKFPFSKFLPYLESLVFGISVSYWSRF